MKIRLGYACISKTLSNVTTSSTVTYTTFQKDKDYKKIDTAIKSNLNALKEILTYNIKNRNLCLDKYMLKLYHIYQEIYIQKGDAD